MAVGLPDERLSYVPDRDAAGQLLLELLRPGDVVLVKASRGVALDQLVDELVRRLGGPEGQA
ncbi:MAG: hypothetical protein C4343_06300 [Chloroflexota bacterium]